jgi:putative glutamine amidotransferase
LHARPPLIGIVTHELLPEPGVALAPGRGRDERTCAPPRLNLRLTYVHAVHEAGGIAVVLPAHGFGDDAHFLLERLDGLLFSGGPDLDPGTYGQAAGPQLGPHIDRAADDYELRLHEAARERDLPVLAVCRGMQALNVARGGTLHQHLGDLTDGSIEHRQAARGRVTTHTVGIEGSSRLARIMGVTEAEVNSFHHQSADRLGKGLRAVAWSPDGVVEGIEDDGDGMFLGVQWHAESLVERREHLALFRALVEEAEGYGSREPAVQAA